MNLCTLITHLMIMMFLLSNNNKMLVKNSLELTVIVCLVKQFSRDNLTVYNTN